MSQYRVWQPGQEAPSPQRLLALKNQNKPALEKSGISSWTVSAIGSILLGLLSIVPIWNAIILERNSNYVYWAGHRVPYAIIIGCVSLVVLYVVAAVALFFLKRHAAKDTENTIMVLGHIFLTLFGLLLMMSSSPLTHQADLTTTNLLYRCDVSEQTHRLFEYSQVLQNIRATPSCAAMYSVEECAGYKEAAPHTSMLKGMEESFRCAGFCWRPSEASIASLASRQALTPPLAPAPGAALASSPAPASPGAAPVFAISSSMTKRNFRQHSLSTENSLPAQHAFPGSIATGAGGLAMRTYPPTLFSDKNYQASCDGMAARDMKHFAGDMGQQLFCMGIYLVFVSVVTGFLRLLGLCARKA